MSTIRWQPGFAAVADPAGEPYDAFGAAASVTGYLHPRSLAALVRATAAGERHGRFEGRETQMPADFVLGPGGRIVLAHYGATSATTLRWRRCWPPSTR